MLLSLQPQDHLGCVISTDAAIRTNIMLLHCLEFVVTWAYTSVDTNLSYENQKLLKWVETTRRSQSPFSQQIS
jgi:hypothetical protein